MKKFLTNKDIMSRIGITFFIIFIYRIGCFITVPEVNQDILATIDSYVFDAGIPVFLNGNLTIMSLFALGVVPYITASIVVQLLEMDIVPKMSEWKEQGEEGRKKRNEVIRISALILAYIQAVGIMFGLNVLTNGLLIAVDPIYYFILAIIMTAGTAVLMWLGDIITENGVGNGISVLIAVSLLSKASSQVNSIYGEMINGVEGLALMNNVILLFITFLVVILVTISTIYFIQAKRKIPINYVGQSARSQNSTTKNFLPLKLNTAGVIPVIFASTLMVIPMFITKFIENEDVTSALTTLFDYSSSVIALLIYCGLIFMFSLLYSFVQINPEKVASNLEKQNAYIAGVRPGDDTADYIETILYRITFWGGIILALIAALPIVYNYIVQLPVQVAVGGTGYIIIIGVTIEIIRQLSTKVEKTNYRGFV